MWFFVGASTRAFLLSCLVVCVVLASWYMGPAPVVVLGMLALLIGIYRMATRVQRQPWMPMALVLTVGMLAFAAPAFAQGTTVSGASIADALKPWIEIVVYVAVTVGTAFAAIWIKSKTGIDIQADHRAALQAALANAAGLVIAKATEDLRTKSIDVKSPILADGIEYVLKASPEAVNYFGLTKEQIAAKVAAKIGISTASSNPATPQA